MKNEDSTPVFVRLEDYTRGPLFVADSKVARANKTVMERHLNAEWVSDIEGTMATIHPDNPYQRIPALGVNVNGFEAIRRFYEGRFASWPGPALKHFDRVAVTDSCVYVEGRMDIQGSGTLTGLKVAGNRISTPVVIVVEFRDALLSGEMVYMDSASLVGG